MPSPDDTAAPWTPPADLARSEAGHSGSDPYHPDPYYPDPYA